MIKSWSDEAWEEYLEWERTDKAVFKRINQLIRDIDRNGNEGIGKPEPLRHQLSGLWSRRINQEHRLIYEITDGQIRIYRCREHYSG